MDRKEEETAKLLKDRIEAFIGPMEAILLENIRVHERLGTVIIPTRTGIMWDWGPGKNNLVFPATLGEKIAAAVGAKFEPHDFGNPYGCSNYLMCFVFSIGDCDDALALAGHFAGVLIKYQHGSNYVRLNEAAIVEAAKVNAAWPPPDCNPRIF